VTSITAKMAKMHTKTKRWSYALLRLTATFYIVRM